jgi:hypothetical protein
MHYQGTLTEAKFSLDYLLLTIETLFTFFAKRATLMRRSTVGGGGGQAFPFPVSTYGC